MLNTGSASLLLERADVHDEEEKELIGRFAGVSLRVEDIHETVDRLRAKGVKFTGAPQKQWWGVTLAHFQDPDENIITLVSDKPDAS